MELHKKRSRLIISIFFYVILVHFHIPHIKDYFLILNREQTFKVTLIPMRIFGVSTLVSNHLLHIIGKSISKTHM